MNQILAILKKDLRRARWWIAAWVAVLVASEYVYMDGLLSEERDYRWVLLGTLSTIGKYIILLLGVAALALTDPVYGPRSNWRTQAISWKSLALAKGILLFVLFAMLPGLVAFVSAFAFPFSVAHAADAALMAAGIGIFAATIGFYIASLSSGIQQWILYMALSLLVFWFVGAGFTQATVGLTFDTRLKMGARAFFIVALGGLGISQYCRSRRGVAVLAGAVVGVSLLVGFGFTGIRYSSSQGPNSLLQLSDADLASELGLAGYRWVEAPGKELAGAFIVAHLGDRFEQVARLPLEQGSYDGNSLGWAAIDSVLADQWRVVLSGRIVYPTSGFESRLSSKHKNSLLVLVNHKRREIVLAGNDDGRVSRRLNGASGPSYMASSFMIQELKGDGDLSKLAADGWMKDAELAVFRWVE